MLPAIQEMDVDETKAKDIVVYDSDLWKTGDFKKEKELGSGASCKVLRVTVKSTRSQAALKEMRRNDEFNPQSYVKEITMLEMLNGHPNLLVFEAAYLDPKNYYIQTGLLEGGELFDRIHSKRRFNEEETSQHICRILDAIAHCHLHQIVHRDLKPENMVYRVKGGGPETLCIIDFGDAKKVDDDGKYEEFVGTAFYLPPEIVRERKGSEMKKSDIWSIGVITYVLLTGRPPFWGNSNKDILKKIIKGKVQFPRSVGLSATAKHFVLNLVQKKIDKRFNIASALKHPFIKNHNKEVLPEIYQRYGMVRRR